MIEVVRDLSRGQFHLDDKLVTMDWGKEKEEPFYHSGGY